MFDEEECLNNKDILCASSAMGDTNGFSSSDIYPPSECLLYQPISNGVSALSCLHTLQIPNNKLSRCDSGNESDVHHSILSSGDVSPAYSDYGGYGNDIDDNSETKELISRKYSRDSAIGSTDTNSFDMETNKEAPAVKIWPVDGSKGNEHEQTTADKAAVEKQTAAQIEEPAELNHRSENDTLKRQRSLEYKRPKPNLIMKQQSAHNLYNHLPTSLTEDNRLVSVDSITSLDDYFSQIDSADLCDTSDAFESCNLSEQHKTILFERRKMGQSEQTYPKLSLNNNRRLSRERHSERALRINVGLEPDGPSHPSTAPVGQEITRLYERYESVNEGSSYMEEVMITAEDLKHPQKRWQAIKGVMPFIERCRKQKWVQLAGHQGSFEKSSEDSLVLKKFSQLEYEAFNKLFSDPLRTFIPKYHGTITKDGTQYCELENLLHGFSSPSVMDCKIGLRTYLEDELAKAEKCPTPRKDMYEKMCKIDPQEPTPIEHLNKAVSKPRYMKWREDISSSSTLGFRIEGIKCADGSSCINFKTSKDKITLSTIISSFTKRDRSINQQYLSRLKELRAVLASSAFFRTHEIIGSSLLFVHDMTKANVWMIDFGKTTQLPEDISITHNLPWKRGNHEDGYLIGLDNLISLFETLLDQSSEKLGISS